MIAKNSPIQRARPGAGRKHDRGHPVRLLRDGARDDVGCTVARGPAHALKHGHYTAASKALTPEQRPILRELQRLIALTR